MPSILAEQEAWFIGGRHQNKKHPAWVGSYVLLICSLWAHTALAE